LWGNLKGKVYHNNPRTIDVLQKNIRNAIANIQLDKLQEVTLNVIHRANLCLEHGGQHYQQYL
jgi:hypothetical protein